MLHHDPLPVRLFPDTPSMPRPQTEQAVEGQTFGDASFPGALAVPRVTGTSREILREKFEEQLEITRSRELAKLIAEFEASDVVQALMRWLRLTGESCCIWFQDAREHEGRVLPGELPGHSWMYSSMLMLTQEGFQLKRVSDAKEKVYKATTHAVDRHGRPIEDPEFLTRLGAQLGLLASSRMLPLEPLRLFVSQGLTIEQIREGVSKTLRIIVEQSLSTDHTPSAGPQTTGQVSDATSTFIVTSGGARSQGSQVHIRTPDEIPPAQETASTEAPVATPQADPAANRPRQTRFRFVNKTD